MRNILKSLLCVAFAVLITGCATITSTSYDTLDGVKLDGTDGKPSEVVFIESILCGSKRHRAHRSFIRLLNY